MQKGFKDRFLLYLNFLCDTDGVDEERVERSLSKATKPGGAGHYQEADVWTCFKCLFAKSHNSNNF